MFETDQSLRLSFKLPGIEPFYLHDEVVYGLAGPSPWQITGLSTLTSRISLSRKIGTATTKLKITAAEAAINGLYHYPDLNTTDPNILFKSRKIK